MGLGEYIGWTLTRWYFWGIVFLEVILHRAGHTSWHEYLPLAGSYTLFIGFFFIIGRIILGFVGKLVRK